MKTDSQLINNVEQIRHIPCTIVQGRYDITCPMDTAWQVHKVSNICRFVGVLIVLIELNTWWL